MKLTTKDMTLIALFTAVTCILAPFALPIGPVPISLTTLVLYFSIYILGTRDATISVVLYLLLGLVGLPVFSGFTGGAAKLFGPTGGYLIGYIPMVIIAALLIPKCREKKVLEGLVLVCATIVLYLLGTIWLGYSAGMGFKAALFAGVIPFIPGDLVKIIIAVVFAPLILKRLEKSGVR